MKNAYLKVFGSKYGIMVLVPFITSALACKGLNRGGMCVTGRPPSISAKLCVGGSHDAPCDVRSLNAVAEMEVGLGG